MLGFIMWLALLIYTVYAYIHYRKRARYFTEENTRLEQKLHRTECRLNNYINVANTLKEQCEGFGKLIDNTPDDCMRGEWCQACQFVKEYYIAGYSNNCLADTPLYICGRNEACEHFVQRG